VLGQKCETDQDCDELTSNSLCSKQPSNEHPVCACKADYVSSDNKTFCVLRVPPSAG